MKNDLNFIARILNSLNDLSARFTQTKETRSKHTRAGVTKSPMRKRLADRKRKNRMAHKARMVNAHHSHRGQRGQ